MKDCSKFLPGGPSAPEEPRLHRRFTIYDNVGLHYLYARSILMGLRANFGVLFSRDARPASASASLMIAPVYAAEISSTHTRDFCRRCGNRISVGILLGYISNNLFANLRLELGWRIMLGIAAIPSLFLAIGILKMPESPRWLIMQGRVGEAKKILCVETIADQANPDGSADVDRGGWRAFLEHATGTGGCYTLRPENFQKAGVTARRKLLLATVGVGLTADIYNHIHFHNRQGRPSETAAFQHRRMIVALTGAGHLSDGGGEGRAKLIWALVLSLIFVYMFLMFFNIGLCPVCWVYSSEIFPTRLRAAGASVSVAVNRLMNATVSMSFFVAVVGNNDWWGVLFVCQRGGGGLVFCFLLLAGDQGAELGGDGGGFQQKW
ncbi:hypothetical protein DH2020_015853 [Rehmannia glutinosa]|uniref:Major facilitator superfamily (MFS) profile domain-containing protein n=1 Tax=Rehmannia glutinosa TaxID=99300 RepID=A0ABR0WUD0_REHGL